jgi:hypothetical protein
VLEGGRSVDQTQLARADNPSAALTLLIGGTIALLAPGDVAFAAATHGSPLARVALLIGLALIGMRFTRLNGLSLHKPGARPVIAGALCALTVAVYVAFIDGWLFRPVLPQAYHYYVHTHGLATRLIYYMCRAFNENVIYRLFAFSALGYALARATQRRTLSFLISMVVVQTINVGLNLSSELSPDQPITTLLLVYFAARGVVPGVIWAGLFWRYGFMAAEIGSVGCHVFLQPMLGALL